MPDMSEVYRQVETCRRKLLAYEWTNQQLREEAWEAERELYELEETMLGWSEDDEPTPFRLT